MLLEEKFQIMSVDASDKMLKYALKHRWNRRKEPAFDKWGMKQDLTLRCFYSILTFVIIVPAVHEK